MGFIWNVSTTIWISVAVMLLIKYLQWHWQRRQLYAFASKLKGPTPWPILGSSHLVLGGPTAIYRNIEKMFVTYGELWRIWFGHHLVCGTHKPEYIETVLTSPKALAKMDLYKYAELVVGHGLFTAPVPKWKRHRRIIMPAFNQKILDGYVDVFRKHSNIFGAQLEKYVDKGFFDVWNLIGKCTVDSLCESAMGVSVNAQTTNANFSHWIDKLLETVCLRIFTIWYHIEFIYRWTKCAEEFSYSTRKFKNFTRKVLEDKKKTHDKNDNANSGQRKSFLDLLIDLSSDDDNKLTKEEILDEVRTLMIAGSDTTGSSIAFVLIMLGMHSEVQEKVYREIMTVVGDREIEYKDLLELKYTEMAIKESLRLFPNAPVILRQIEDDITLEEDLVLPKGSAFLVGIMATHRNPDIWDDPLKFNPDRFLPETVAKRHPFSYLPFSAGPRNCIGFKYAMMLMKTVVATVVRKYELSTNYKTVEDITLKLHLILRTENGFNIAVKLRKK